MKKCPDFGSNDVAFTNITKQAKTKQQQKHVWVLLQGAWGWGEGWEVFQCAEKKSEIMDIKTNLNGTFFHFYTKNFTSAITLRFLVITTSSKQKKKELSKCHTETVQNLGAFGPKGPNFF